MFLQKCLSGEVRARGTHAEERAILCTGAQHVPSLGLVLVFELNFSRLAIINNYLGTVPRAHSRPCGKCQKGTPQSMGRPSDVATSFSRTHRMTVKAGHPAVSTGVLALVVVGFG